MNTHWLATFSAKLPHRLALGWLVLVVLAGLASPLLPLPFPPTTPDLLHIAAPPSWSGPGPLHYLGTDPTGRDVLAELLFGAQQLLLFSLPAAAAATLLGALAGGAAGFWGNRGLTIPWVIVPTAIAVIWWVGALPQRLIAVSILLIISILFLLSKHWRLLNPASRLAQIPLFFPLDSMVLGSTTLLSAVPRLILVVALAAGPPLGTGPLLALLLLVAWPDAARLVRAQMLRVRAQPFVEAARAAGLPAGRIWWRHALPHACHPLWAFAPLSVAGLIGLESTLGFLGIGLLPTTSSWGRLLGTLPQEPTAWWLAAGPGLALLFTLLALQRLAEWLSTRYCPEL
jgi:peptide/nickel transport system permease protein